MTSKSFIDVLKVLLVLALPAQAFSQDSDSELWKDIKLMLPSSTNAILAINAESMFDSDLARKNDWRESHAEQFERNPTMLPPIASRFVLATEMDTEHFEPQRELAVISTSSPIDYDEIRKRVEGNSDTIAGFRAIHTPRDSYVISIDSHLVALARLSSRQWIAQQINEGHGRKELKLPSILVDAIDRVSGDKSQIAMAVYLEDAVPRSAMNAMIERSSVLGEAAQKAPTLVDEMMQLQGVVFTIDITDSISGRLAMVFKAEPTQLSAIAKPIMLELLSSAGAVLPEFKDWQDVSNSNSLALEGKLSIEGLRRVLSLLSVQSTELQSDGLMDTTAIEPSPKDVKAKATANYIKRVTRLAKSVIAGGRAGSLRDQVLWTDRSAKTILRISERDVDYDAVRISRQIAYGMLDIVSVFQEADQKAQARFAVETPPTVQWRTELVPYRGFSTPYGRFYQYRPFSYAQVFAVENAIRGRQIMAEELGNANTQAKEVIARIESEVATLNQLPAAKNPK
jgi:hypothetical protein